MRTIADWVHIQSQQLEPGQRPHLEWIRPPSGSEDMSYLYIQIWLFPFRKVSGKWMTTFWNHILLFGGRNKFVIICWDEWILFLPLSSVSDAAAIPHNCKLMSSAADSFFRLGFVANNHIIITFCFTIFRKHQTHRRTFDSSKNNVWKLALPVISGPWHPKKNRDRFHA